MSTAPDTTYSYSYAVLPSADPYFAGGGDTALIQTSVYTDPDTGQATTRREVVAIVQTDTSVEISLGPEVSESLIDVIVAALNGGAS